MLVMLERIQLRYYSQRNHRNHNLDSRLGQIVWIYILVSIQNIGTGLKFNFFVVISNTSVKQASQYHAVKTADIFSVDSF